MTVYSTYFEHRSVHLQEDMYMQFYGIPFMPSSRLSCGVAGFPSSASPGGGQGKAHQIWWEKGKKIPRVDQNQHHCLVEKRGL
jgi:hypothetical protein